MTAADGTPGTACRPEAHRSHPDRLRNAGRGGAAAGGEKTEMQHKRGRPRLVVGISGASGAIYGARLLELLRPLPVETHLVMSRSAEVTLGLETGLKLADLRARAA